MTRRFCARVVICAKNVVSVEVAEQTQTSPKKF